MLKRKKPWNRGGLKRKDFDESLVQDDRSFYEELWKERPHKCQSCGVSLPSFRVIYMDHLLEKSSYPNLRHDKRNIFIVCIDCHTRKTNGFPLENHQKAIENARNILL